MKRDLLHPLIRSRAKRLPPPHDAHYGVVPPPPPETISQYEINQDCAEAIAAIAKLDLMMLGSQSFVATRLLTRREAVSSSSIEGTQSTLDEILELEEHGSGSARAEAKQVRSYSLSLEHSLGIVRAGGRQAFSVELIRGIHRELMSNDPSYSDPPGDFRTRTVWIGQGGIEYSTYNPPPHDDVSACMEDHVRFLRGDGMDLFLPLPVRMAIAHAHFEGIHPFRDGNGRVGRLLLPLMMAAEGHQPLFIAPYLEAHRQHYYEALQEAQQHWRWDPIVRLVCHAIVRSLEEATATHAALTQLPAIWRPKVRLRERSTALRALAILADWPVLTVDRMAKLLNVSFQAANEAVKVLVPLGILQERTGYQHNRIFVAPNVLRIMNRPFGQPPTFKAPA